MIGTGAKAGNSTRPLPGLVRETAVRGPGLHSVLKGDKAMMSVSPGKIAEHAGGYFSKEDHYLRGAEHGQNSRWCGEGASALGLDGQVSEEEFQALCRGE